MLYTLNRLRKRAEFGLILYSVLMISFAFLFGLSALGAGNPTLPTLVVDFSQGSSEVTPAMKQKIQEFVTHDKKGNKIAKVYAAVWADKEREGNESQSKDEEALATDREAKLKDFLENHLRLNVDTFNMAARANPVSRLFHSEDSRVKGDATATEDPIAAQIQNNAKPSVAVLVIENEKRSRGLAE